MADPEHLSIITQGVATWNAWRRQRRSRGIWPDLRDAALQRAALSEANLRHTNLSGANLSGADLRRAILLGANLHGANLHGAKLFRADLSSADLRGTRLRRADLGHTDLTVADLYGADLSGAKLHGALLLKAHLCEADFCKSLLHQTVFADVDLSHAKGLDTCRHLGPSIIDHLTLQRCSRLPLSFLRGCGFTDNLIDHLPSLFNQPIQFYSCFISYTAHGDDNKFAHRLYADLQASGVRCWFAPHDLKIGDELRPTFDEAIRLRDKLLVILSERSLQRPWVKREVEQALEEEQRRNCLVLFPVRLDDAIFDIAAGWATDLKRRHIGDFRRWKHHEDYRKSFERLLRDLRMGGKAEPVPRHLAAGAT